MAAIDNLGDYGKLTTAAKAAGGVNQLIGHFENAAVARAAPGLRMQGGLVGLGLGAVGMGVYWLYSRRLRSRIERLEEARSELREALDDVSLQDMNPEDDNPNSATSPV